MQRDHLSGKELAVCLGLSPYNAGKRTDAALERIAPVAIDHLPAFLRMLADAVEQCRQERPELDERQAKALGMRLAE